jgi:hypothetical protein
VSRRILILAVLAACGLAALLPAHAAAGTNVGAVGGKDAAADRFGRPGD